MAKPQPERIQVAQPFNALLKDKGWMVRNFNPDQATDSVPDCFAQHPIHGGRWIEYKLWYGNSISCTRTQKTVFPELMDHGMEIFCIVALDMRREENYNLRQHLYSKLFAPFNGRIMFEKENWSQLR